MPYACVSVQERKSMTEVQRITSINNETEYQAALVEIGRLWNAAPGSPEEAYLEALASLLNAYEREHEEDDPEGSGERK